MAQTDAETVGPAHRGTSRGSDRIRRPELAAPARRTRTGDASEVAWRRGRRELSPVRPGSVRPPTGAKARVGPTWPRCAPARARGPAGGVTAEQDRLAASIPGLGCGARVFDELRPDLQWARDQLDDCSTTPRWPGALQHAQRALHPSPTWSRRSGRRSNAGFRRRTGARARLRDEPSSGWLGRRRMVQVEVEPATAAIRAGLQPHAGSRRIVRRVPPAERQLRSGRRECPVRLDRAQRQGAQRRPPLDPQPLHHQEPAPDRPGGGRIDHLPLPRLAQSRRSAGDGRALTSSAPSGCRRRPPARLASRRRRRPAGAAPPSPAATRNRLTGSDRARREVGDDEARCG
ncbi:hypothetical protein HBB16_09520 [Pseudonocardia sp. MCCB 268]|nr:hypothetical protein [Pseudonocardia cytotoxica]